MDLLRNLPDDVLCHILSFLTTKEAALTSVLSKRWRYLFALVPSLVIDDFLFRYPEESKEEWGHIRQLFMDFVDRVLALQGNSPIKRFSLHCVVVDSDRMDAWIHNVMVRGVSELELSMKSGHNYRRYDSGIWWLDGSIFLPMLKTLILDSVLLSVDKFEILHHAFPSLEELVLRSIVWKDWKVADVIVSSASLKNLTIYNIGSVLNIDTPSLVNFCYSDYVAKYYSVAKMENLLEARISLWVTRDEINQARAPNNDWLQDNVALRFANVGKLMNGIRNVQYLKICAHTLEVLSLCCVSMPVFNLKSLSIENNKSGAWQVMPVLLRNCPHLETLCIGSHPDISIHSTPIGWLAGGIFLPMLKTLVLESVGFYVDKFFLRPLPALEELVLVDVFWLWSDKDVTVSNASLKTLTLNFNHYSGTFSFDTPSLVYFCYSDYVAKDYPLVKMDNLFEARISLLVTEDQIQRARAPNNDWLEDAEDNVVLQFANVGKLMNGIQNVQCLYLSANTLEVLSLCCESLLVFNNLKSLTIESDESRGWQAMPVLIRNSPHLDTLVLEGLMHHVTDKCGDACECVYRKDKGRSLTSCPVKMLKIKGFQGTMKEMHMVKHFLDYFPHLKEIKFYMKEYGPIQLRVPEVSEVIAEVMEHYKKSSSCNVQRLVRHYLYKKCTAE